jgi:hypothetical protein
MEPPEKNHVLAMYIGFSSGIHPSRFFAKAGDSQYPNGKTNIIVSFQFAIAWVASTQPVMLWLDQSIHLYCCFDGSCGQAAG